MKRYILLSVGLALTALACQQATPPAVACVAAPTQAGVTVNTPISVASGFKEIAAEDIAAVEPNRLLTDPTGLDLNSLIASNCNDGLLRRVTVQPAAVPSGGARPQSFSKVYIQTEDIPLEQVISAGDVDLDYGDLDFAKAQSMQLQSGVQVQAATGTLDFTNQVLTLGPASVAFKGQLLSTLQPKFRLKFSNGSVERFELGLSGSLGVNLEARVSATAAVDNTKELEVAKFEFKRVFLIGAVPVVIVITPRLVVGYAMAVTGDVSVTAKATPTLNMGYGMKYVRTANPKWSTSPTAPSITFNPIFNYTNQVTGTAGVYAKLLVGVKLYGVAGPDLEALSEIKLELKSSGNPLAKLTFGSSATGSLAGGFKVLGLDLNVNLGSLNVFKQTKGFSCANASTCTALP